MGHALRWGVFSIRRVAYSGYGVLQFASKPGARLMLPALLVVAAYLGRVRLEAVLDGNVLHAPWGAMPEPLTLEVGGSAALAATLSVCAVLWSCAFQLRWLAGTLSGLLRVVVIAAVVLFFVGLVVALHSGQPLDAWAQNLVPHHTLAKLGDTEIVDDGPTLAWPNWGMSNAPWALHGMLAVAVLVLTCVYVVASRGLALVLGAFPPMTAPLPPMRALRVKEADITPVAVTIAVPRLPRRRRA